MLSIKMVFKLLTDDERKMIMKAFNTGEPFLIQFKPKQVIGCHYEDLSSFNIHEQTEYWFVGEFK